MSCGASTDDDELRYRQRWAAMRPSPKPLGAPEFEPELDDLGELAVSVYERVKGHQRRAERWTEQRPKTGGGTESVTYERYDLDVLAVEAALRLRGVPAELWGEVDRMLLILHRTSGAALRPREVEALEAALLTDDERAAVPALLAGRRLLAPGSLLLADGGD